MICTKYIWNFAYIVKFDTQRIFNYFLENMHAFGFSAVSRLPHWWRLLSPISWGQNPRESKVQTVHNLHAHLSRLSESWTRKSNIVIDQDKRGPYHQNDFIKTNERRVLSFLASKFYSLSKTIGLRGEKTLNFLLNFGQYNHNPRKHLLIHYSLS